LSYFRLLWMIACPAPASNERGLPKGVGLFSFDTRGAGMWGGGSRHHRLRIAQTALTDAAPIKVLISFDTARIWLLVCCFLFRCVPPAGLRMQMLPSQFTHSQLLMYWAHRLTEIPLTGASALSGIMIECVSLVR